MYYIIIFIFIIFYLILKCNTETFLNYTINSYNIRINKPIFLINKNLFNITNNNDHLLLKKTDNLYYSNEFITNYSSNNGFIFKPINCKNIKIGLSYLNNDKLNYYYNFIGNNYFKIEELDNDNELENDKYIIEDLDYCFNTNITECKKKNLYQFKDTDLFCLLIENNIINYIIIKNYEKTEPLGILLHKSKKITNSNKLYTFISNIKNNNKITDLFWINKNIDTGDELKNIKWSLNYISKNKYNKKILPKKEKLYGPSPTISDKKVKKKIYFAKSSKQIIIDEITLNTNNKLLLGEDNYLHIVLLYHNISTIYLKNIYSIDTIIYFKNKKIVIPFLKKSDYYRDYLLLKININKLINIIKNDKIKIQVMIRPFKISDDKLNLKSKIKEFQINI